MSKFIWKEKKVNDIDSNPLECWICKTEMGEHERIYRIVPQYPSDETGLTTSDEPELYVLFEEIVFEGRDGRIHDSDYFVKACKTLDEAKKRAELQYSHIANIIHIYFEEEHSNDK